MHSIHFLEAMRLDKEQLTAVSCLDKVGDFLQEYRLGQPPVCTGYFTFVILLSLPTASMEHSSAGWEELGLKRADTAVPLPPLT